MKTAIQIYETLTDSYLMHYGTPGMHWRQQGPGKRYQSQAVYAQGRPNPNGKVRGAKKSVDEESISKLLGEPTGGTGLLRNMVSVFSDKSFNSLSDKDRHTIVKAATNGKNTALNKKITAAIKSENDGTRGTVFTKMWNEDGFPKTKAFNYEIRRGEPVYSTAWLGKKMSKSDVDGILNHSITGGYTRYDVADQARVAAQDAAFLSASLTALRR